MRLLLFLLYYGIAFLMGFVIRARFDTWMYSKPHMQARLVVWAADTVSYVESGGPGPVLPPETTDAQAFSPVLGQSRIGRLARRTDAEDAAGAVPEGLAGEQPPAADDGSGAPPPVRPA
ncbi:MAG: hypothetical protein OXQ28_11270 [Acidobacteriota bacterium]|nr:hypothetical protein [Acidobacteriota bacterium]